MSYYYQNYDTQNTATLIPLVDNTRHIKLDPEIEDNFDMEAVWCSLCERPRFGDVVTTDICICPAVINSIDSWLHKPVENTAFDNSQTSHYGAVDSWLHMSGNDNIYSNNVQSSHYNTVPVSFSVLPATASTSYDTVSTKDMSSPSTSATPPHERRSPSTDHRDWPQESSTMITKQKRREQNRISQRTFRQRKDQITKDLQVRVEELTKLNENLNNEVLLYRMRLEDFTQREPSQC